MLRTNEQNLSHLSVSDDVISQSLANHYCRSESNELASLQFNQHIAQITAQLLNHDPVNCQQDTYDFDDVIDMATSEDEFVDITKALALAASNPPALLNISNQFQTLLQQSAEKLAARLAEKIHSGER